jgi:hypothetical protein
MRKKLEDKLDTKSFSIRLCSDKVQEENVSKFCKKHKPHMNEEHLNAFTTDVLQLVQRCMKDRSRQFTGIHLHCIFLAQAFVEHVKIYVQEGNIDLDLLQFCNRLVEKKFDIYRDKYKIDRTKAGPSQDYTCMRSVFQNSHMIAGVLNLLPSLKSVCTTYSSHMANESTTACFINSILEQAIPTIRQIEDGCERIGITVETGDDTPVFVY